MITKIFKVFLFLSVFYATIIYAAHYVTGQDSVDNGEIRWDSSTVYSSQWNYAVSKWNEQGDINIAPDTWYTNKDLDVYDVNRPWASYYGQWIYYNSAWYSDEIQFNVAKLNNKTNNQQKYTAMHELGHALGLEHHSIYGNVMKSGIDSQTYLGPQDKSDYNYLWD